MSLVSRVRGRLTGGEMIEHVELDPSVPEPLRRWYSIEDEPEQTEPRLVLCPEAFSYDDERGCQVCVGAGVYPADDPVVSTRPEHFVSAPPTVVVKGDQPLTTITFQVIGEKQLADEGGNSAPCPVRFAIPTPSYLRG